MSIQERLFIGVFPCGIVYADRTIEDGGDYKRIAFLPYKELLLSVGKQCSRLMLNAITEHAQTIIAKRGERFETSACGQSVVLGA